MSYYMEGELIVCNLKGLLLALFYRFSFAFNYLFDATSKFRIRVVEFKFENLLHDPQANV